MSIAAGTKLGRYKSRARLGEGGMGVVYLAHNARFFQKKSTRGINTPKAEIDLVKDRMKRLKEMLR